MRKKNILIAAMTICALSCVAFGFTACKKNSTLYAEEKIQTSLSYEYLSATNMTLRIGEIKTLTASTQISAWTSDDTTIATVQDGKVTAVKEGITFVGATTKSGETLCCLINVTSVAFAPQIELNYQFRTLNIHDEWTLNAMVSMDGAALDMEVIWSNTDDSVLNVVKNGNTATVKAIGAGQSTVYATIGDSSVSCTFTVRVPANTSGVFTECEEMASAGLTQSRFDEGVETVGDYDTTSDVSVYREVYYGEYEDNTGTATNSLIAYATLLEDANKPRCLEYEGYYAYGILVSVSQSHNAEMGAYAGKTYRFYASADANEDGQYGVFVQNVLWGHYLVRAFVEYEQDGEIVTKISENESAAGDLHYVILSSAEDITVMVNDSKCMSYGTEYAMEDVDIAVTDNNNLTINAVYSATIPDTTLRQHFNAPKFRFQTGLTKELFRALISEGNATLSFYTMFKSVDGEYLGVNVLDQTADYSSSAITDDASTVNKHLTASVSDGTSNVWYYVEYELSFLLENYDLLFNEKTNYPFMDLDRTPMSGGTFYLSRFAVNKSEEQVKSEVRITLNDEIVDNTIIVAETNDVFCMSNESDAYIYTVNGQHFNGEYVLTEEGVYLFAVQAKGENAKITYEVIVGNGNSVSEAIDMSELTVGTPDDNIYYHAPGVVKKHATYNGVQEIALKEFNSDVTQESKAAHAWSYSGKYAHYMGPQVHLTSAITKEELQALYDAGYTTFSFEVTATEGVSDNKTDDDYYKLDFEKIKVMIESSADMDEARATVEKSLKAWENTAHNDYMTKLYKYRSSWVTISYNVQDLIVCYDLLDLLPLYFDSFVCSNTENPFWNLYMTAFTFAKEISMPLISINGITVENAVVFVQPGTLNATVNAPYELMINGEKLVAGTTLASGTYMLTAGSAYSEQTASVKLVVAEDLNNLSGFVDMSKLTVGTSDNQIYYYVPGIINKYATYNGVEENVAFKQYYSETLGDAKTAHVWSYSGTYEHYAGPQVHLTSTMTKAELQALLDAGYTTMSFNFTVSQGVDDNKTGDDYYKLDFEKIKAMIESSADMDEAKATVQQSLKAWENTAHNDYMTKGWNYRGSWKNVTYNVADLIACYEVLDLLPLFYDGISSAVYNVYMTDITFIKA